MSTRPTRATLINPERPWIIILENDTDDLVEIKVANTGYEARQLAIRAGVAGGDIKVYTKQHWRSAVALMARAWRFLVLEDRAPVPSAKTETLRLGKGSSAKS